MKIVILGAGQVGRSAAEILAREGNDITLVDRDAKVIHGLDDAWDIRTEIGSASSPEVLERAGTGDADLVLAVTNSDEINMIACQIAHSIFNAPTKIARVRSPAYLNEPKLFCPESIPIDFIISPEQAVTDQIMRLIEYPGALQVLDFAGGKIRLVALRADSKGALVGHQLRELTEHLPTVHTHVAAIYRKDTAIIPTGTTVIEPEDEVFFIATKEDIHAVMQELRTIEKVGKNIILAGAGNIGVRLAQTLEGTDLNVKLIERDPVRAKLVAEQLDTNIFCGDATDERLLRAENIDEAELFCALTNEDEANILSAMLAKALKVKRSMAIVNRSTYIDIIIKNELLDIALSPRLATTSALLYHVRRGDVQAAHSLRRGAAEAIEAVAHGDRATSKIVGRALGEIKLPEDATIGAIMRDDKLVPINDDVVIEENDHVVIFVIDKQRIPEVEKLFQVSATFF